ncbi:CocE/NonD family hydrolase [Streptomyces europaeiscabiei]|uniref:CocE/NonD family hydrolase n=1 Tax=Streptomyces europaeiscabiei TaxID=146819 RepID=UPI002E2E5F90|nr:CocE/NonD family hydrolase [Streptomyces europaeiscabiei]
MPIQTTGGRTVMADVYRPADGGPHPAVMCFTPYGKDIHFSVIDKSVTKEYAVYEAPDITRWVADEYAVVIVDAAGLGTSPGVIDVWSRRDIDDYHDTIEFIGEQPWCTGRVGLSGISYLSATQIAVAALRPPHLTCIIPWEVGGDNYQMVYQEGMLNTFFLKSWFDAGIVANQYGRDRLSPAELEANRIDYPSLAAEHPLFDDYWAAQTPDLSRITVPFYTAANWTGAMLSLQQHFDLFHQAASRHKWLRAHSGGHIEPYYADDGYAEQKRFMDYWLKDIDNGLLDVPPLKLAVRRPDRIEWVHEREWPPARTQWTTWYLDGHANRLTPRAPEEAATVTFEASVGEPPNLEKPAADGEHDAVHLSDAVVRGYIAAGLAQPREQEWNAVFSSEPLETELRLIGPVTLHLTVAASAGDTDLFVCLRDISPDGTEVVYDGVDNPETPVSIGWGRLSRRALDESRTIPELHRPVHRQDKEDPPAPGETVQIDIPIGPTSTVFEAGHRLVLEVASRDVFRAFPFLHISPDSRRTGGTVTLQTGGDTAWLELPLVPA